MKRTLVGLSLLVLVTTACTAGGGNSQPSPLPSTISHKPVTLLMWSPYTGREKSDYAKVLASFHAQYPWITVDHVGGKTDSDVIRAINSGTPPDVALSFGPDNVAKFCSTNAWVNLNSYIQADHLNIRSIIAPSALAYTSYNGDQCALPTLSDAYGLYYNKRLFARVGISSPPTTLSELSADAKKLTQFNPDGSIKVAGFVPLGSSFYENWAIENGTNWGAQWYSAPGKAAFATDPRWAQLLEWQKSLVDWFGYSKLQQFFGSLGGANSEWSSSNGFEKGRIAMIMDGEWRVAFIAADHAKIDYGTAPFPAPDNEPQLYGAGVIGGDVMGICRGSAHEADAWLLVKYLATNTQAQTRLGVMLKNVPTQLSALKDPALTGDPAFATFLRIFANPHSAYKPGTPLGTTDETMWDNFVDKYLAGNVPNLHQGLVAISQQIDNQFSLG